MSKLTSLYLTRYISLALLTICGTVIGTACVLPTIHPELTNAFMLPYIGSMWVGMFVMIQFVDAGTDLAALKRNTPVAL